MVGVGGGWWIPLHYLVTSENDFRLSEAVTKIAHFRNNTAFPEKKIYQQAHIFHKLVQLNRNR